MKLIGCLIAVFILISQDLPKSQSSVYKALPKAHKLWIDGDIKGSIAEFTKRNDDALNNYNLALLHFRIEEYATALKYITASIKQNDDFADAYFLRGLIFKKGNFIEQAIASIKEAIDEDSEGIYYLELADLFQQNGQNVLAQEMYENAADEDPSLMRAHLEVAKKIALEDNDEAIEYLEDALENEFPSHDYFIVLGDFYLKKKNTNKAIQLYEQYIQYYPFGQFIKIAKSKLRALNVTSFKQAFNPNSLTEKFKIKKSEYIRYDVSYGFSLGGLDITVADSPIYFNKKEVFKVDYRLSSTSFLISLEAFFEAFINTKNLDTEISYFARELGEKINEQKIYIFDRKKHEFRSRIVKAGGQLVFLKKEMPINAQDGNSLLFYARGLVANKDSQTVITVIGEKFKRTDIYQQKNLENEVIFDKEDSFHYIKSKSHYKGIAGMTGDAEGYFSKDSYVPVLGKMQIIVGKVRVELVELR